MARRSKQPKPPQDESMKMFSLRLPRQTIELLERTATSEGRPAANLARLLIEAGLRTRRSEATL